MRYEVVGKTIILQSVISNYYSWRFIWF